MFFALCRFGHDVRVKETVTPLYFNVENKGNVFCQVSGSSMTIYKSRADKRGESVIAQIKLLKMETVIPT